MNRVQRASYFNRGRVQESSPSPATKPKSSIEIEVQESFELDGLILEKGDKIVVVSEADKKSPPWEKGKGDDEKDKKDDGKDKKANDKKDGKDKKDGDKEDGEDDAEDGKDGKKDKKDKKSPPWEK